jgi:hypothetical protein
MKQPPVMECDYCRREYDSSLPIVANFQIGAMIYYYYYCSDECKRESYLKLIREAGL